MKEELQRKVNLMAQNSKIVRNSAKADFTQAANLGALLFTAEDLVASERDIRANRKLLKSRAGIMSNMRGPAANLALLARMSLKADAEDYLEKVMAAYDRIKAKKVFKSESLVFAAMAMVENTEPGKYDAAATDAWATLDKMRASHPLLTNQDDLTLAHLLSTSGLDVDALLDEAEEVYEVLKPTGFKLKKDTLQSISLILALSDKSVQEKCDKFSQIRDAMRKAGHRIYGQELAVLAAFVDIDKPVDEIAADVMDVDNTLKHVTGFGPLLCGGNLRRLYASALTLQAYEKEKAATGVATSNAIAENVVAAIIFQIIMIIVMTTVIASSTASSAS